MITLWIAVKRYIVMEFTSNNVYHENYTMAIYTNNEESEISCDKKCST